MSGPPPKAPHLRQRTNKKSSHATIEAVVDAEVPPIPNPDGREWHELTMAAWVHAWQSPMASQWLTTDVDALGRLAVLWDAFYCGAVSVMAEIRLQEQRFGLSPLDRSRLQWEVARGNEAERKRPKAVEPQKTGTDPRAFLREVK